MQLAVLDRIAGTQAAAADLGSQLRRLRALDAQLAAIDALGDEDTRATLQRLVDEVGLGFRVHVQRMPACSRSSQASCQPQLVVCWRRTPPSTDVSMQHSCCVAPGF